MENTSKALLMAAEILVGVILLSLIATLIYIFSNYKSEVENNEKVKQLQEFNTQFEVYKDITLTPQDVLTIYNMVKNYNNKFDTEVQQLKLIIDGKVNNSSEFLDSSQKYKITLIDYNEDGKINKIVIEKTK